MGEVRGTPPLSEMLFSEENLSSVAGRVAESACRNVPAVRASTSVVRDGRLVATAGTDARARQFESAQQSGQVGPSVTCLRTGQLCVVDDVRTSREFVALRATSIATAVRSCLAVPLLARSQMVAIVTLYATTIGAFGDTSQRAAYQFAVGAAVVVANAELQDRTAKLAVQLHQALASQPTIDQAKGILMARNACSADEAFQILRIESQHTNCKLRDVAIDVVISATKVVPDRNQ
jgi:GAF domain-containing protein